MAETETCEVDVAFEAIYRDHSQAVYGLVRRICGPALAGRVAQDVFARLWTHPERFDPTRSSLRSFLLDNANNEAIDAVRAETSRACREKSSTQRAPRGDDDHELIGHERSARMAWAIGALPAPERDAVVSAFYGEVAYREAARMLAVSDGAFRAQVRAGLMKLRLAVDALDATSLAARRAARGPGLARAGSPDPPRRRRRTRPPPTPGHRLPE